MQKLKLTVNQIKALQEKHGVKNLIVPQPEEAAKIANVEFLSEFVYEGSRKWEKPPSHEEIGDLDFSEMLEAYQAFMNPAKKDGPGNV